MVGRIDTGSALAREAWRAAQRLASERPAVPSAPTPPSAPGSMGADSISALAPADSSHAAEFARALESGVERMDQDVRTADTMPADLLTGKVDDFHEIAVQLKSAELSFKFAMEIRNKLIDAYREVMRMSV